MLRSPLQSDDKEDQGEHIVQFYETDAFLLEALSSFIGTGLRKAEGCMVIATLAHQQQLEDSLQASGLHLAFARTQGIYLSRDAHELLAQFMLDGSPEPERFAAVVGSLIRSAAAGGRHVRIFGEMVAELWAQGKQAATIRLEELWNELRPSMPPFSLLCAYPMAAFAGEESGEPFRAICQQHTHVLPDESYTALSSPQERLRAITLLQQKVRSLEAEIEKHKAEEHEPTKDVFISIVAHELKTPLTALQGYLQLVQRRLRRLESVVEPGPGESRKLVEDALALLSHGQHLLGVQDRLINDLLDIARLQQHALELRLAPCDLLGLVAEIVQDYQTTHPHRLIALDLPEQESLLVEMDRDRIGQVLGNYLTNALKYSPPDQPVHVGLAAEEAIAYLWVQDHGPGIAQEAQQRIWERFYQAPGIEAQSGSDVSLGLGLYICQQLIGRHHGQVGVESRPGQGARFWFRLPLPRPDA
jgi:signal transduction histidine kinase